MGQTASRVLCRSPAAPKEPAWDKPNPIARFSCSMGVFTAEIYLDRVPITASNFIDLCQSGFYDGLHFHRVIPGFMNQFGCPYSKDPDDERSGTGNPEDGLYTNLATGGIEQRFNGGNIRDEHTSKDSNREGTLSMANTGQRHTAGSQFFLNVADNRNLDWFTGGLSRHVVFGRILEGFEVVEAISVVETEYDNPVEPIVMHKVTVDLGA